MANSRFPKFGYGRSAVFAKGRMKAGMLNKTEQNYKEYLEQERQCGRVIAYWFEAIKLKIAEGTCWYNPDFLVLRPNGDLELHEVKGCPRLFADDAKVKTKACATLYPFKMFVVFPRSKANGGGWEYQEY